MIDVLELIALIGIALFAYVAIMSIVLAILWSDGERSQAERERLQEGYE